MKWEIYLQWKKHSRECHLLPRGKIHHPFFLFVVGVAVQLLSRVQLVANPWTAALQASLSITISQSLLRLISIESVMPSNHLILCRPLLLLPSIFPSIRVFSNESALRIRWLKDYSFKCQHQSFQWIFRVDLFLDWLARSPCSSRDSQESSPTPPSKSISSFVLSLLSALTHISIYDCWKNHSFNLYGPLLAKWCLRYLIYCLGWP